MTNGLANRLSQHCWVRGPLHRPGMVHLRAGLLLRPPAKLTPNTRLVAYQLGNVYGLLAMVSIAVLYTTTEAKVVRNYLIALWIADIGHVAATLLGFGAEELH